MHQSPLHSLHFLLCPAANSHADAAVSYEITIRRFGNGSQCTCLRRQAGKGYYYGTT